jgi:hypothetical protein
MFPDIIQCLIFIYNITFPRMDILSPPSGKACSVGPGLVPIYGHLHQHQIGYTSQAEHKLSARVKTEHQKESPHV